MTPTDRARDWEHTWFGVWRVEHGETDLPSVHEFIDPSWLPADKDQMIKYLTRSPVVVATVAGYSDCLLCSARSELGCWQSDGTWLWPADLEHYVGVHGVVLPSRLVEHIRHQGYNPPTELDVPIENLPWPD